MDHLTTLFNRHPWLELLVERSIKVLLIIAVVLACAKLIHMLSSRILNEAHKAKLANNKDGHEREKRLATVVKLIDTTLRVILFAFGFLMILKELGLDITPFLTGAGIAGVALGFGSQSLVKDMISGFFILIEDQIRVGDVIKINNGLSGSVERMELRVTAIRDADGTLHIIPNGEIKSVSNMTYEFANAVVDLPVPYQTDLKKLIQAMTDVARGLEADSAWKDRLRGRPEFIGIVKFESDHMLAEISVKTEPHSRWAVAREIRNRMVFAAEVSGLGLPRGFTVHFQPDSNT